jgi:hypothetical protein
MGGVDLSHRTCSRPHQCNGTSDRLIGEVVLAADTEPFSLSREEIAYPAAMVGLKSELPPLKTSSRPPTDSESRRITLASKSTQSCTLSARVQAEIVAVDGVFKNLGAIVEAIVFVQLLALADRALPAVGDVIVLINLGLIAEQNELIRVPAIAKGKLNVHQTGNHSRRVHRTECA